MLITEELATTPGTELEETIGILAEEMITEGRITIAVAPQIHHGPTDVLTHRNVIPRKKRKARYLHAKAANPHREPLRAFHHNRSHPQQHHQK
jgi:hypothetical protein